MPLTRYTPMLLLLILTLGACQKATKSGQGSNGGDGRTLELPVCTQQAEAALSLNITLPEAQLIGLRIEARRREGGVETTILSSADYDDASGSASFGAFYEQEGTYDVTIRRGATVLRTFSGVTVDADECHVNGVVLSYP